MPKVPIGSGWGVLCTGRHQEKLFPLTCRGGESRAKEGLSWGSGLGHVLESGKNLNSCRDKKKVGISRQRGSTFLLVGIYDLEDETESKFLKIVFSILVCVFMPTWHYISVDFMWCTIHFKLHDTIFQL